MTRSEAKKQGLKTYDGKPHSCGTTTKYVNGCGCVQCLSEKGKKNLYNEELMSKYKSPEKTWKRVRSWRKKRNKYYERLELQGKRCAICGITKDKNGRDFASDHDHETGQLRGLLCGNCNMGLGLFQDNIELLIKAGQYLERYATV